MRTPGRCTNHESCWLANGGRDIWVPVGDEFLCPVCGEPLTAPSLQSISMRSLAGAAAASLALVALAGGAGFGLVRTISVVAHGTHGKMTAARPTAPRGHVAPQLAAAAHGTATASINPPPAPPAAAPKAAPAALPAAPGTQAPTALASAPPPAPKVASVSPATAEVAKFPAPPAPAAVPVGPLAEATQPAPAPQPKPASPVVAKPEVTQAASFTKAPPSSRPAPVAVASAEGTKEAEHAPPMPPVQAIRPSGPPPSAPRQVAVAQPITYGQPPGPEDASVDSTGRWRHRPSHAARTGFLPAPGWSQPDESSAGEATAPYQVAQGDTEESAPGAGAGFDGGTAVPNLQSDTGASSHGAASDAAAGGAQLPGIVPQTVPRFDGAAGAETAPDTTPRMVTRLSVPWMGGHSAVDVPAARVDAAAANEIDDAPDAPIRLARLPAAAPAKLALPAYPPMAEDLDKPGRVDVGCTITIRGVPADCAVTRNVGGLVFANSVMSWLNSGEVRYRPHLEHGHPVPEARRYDVKFVP